jgi:hypothetical protein
MYWNELAQVRVQWQSLVKAVKTFSFNKRGWRNFLRS